MRCLHLISALSAALALCASTQANSLDALYLHDSASEAAHAVVQTDTTAGVGALDETARWINPDGEIFFDIAVDGTKQNYITARFWGGVSGNQGRIFLGNAAGTTTYNWGQFDDASSSEVAPDRWYYVTVPIPTSLTNGQSTVRLSLSAMGNASSYSNPPTTNTQTATTRGIYALFSHTDTHLQITDDVAQNPIVDPYDYGDYTAPNSIQKLIEHNSLVSFANNIAFQVAAKQTLNTSASNVPNSLLGAFDIRTGSSELDSLNATHYHHMRTDNLGPMRGATILAYAYNMYGTSFYQDATTLNNIALGLDYTRRAQGSSGGYVDVWSPQEWVGGYEGSPRTVGTGSLEGITHGPIAQAFLLTYEDMQTAGLLDELIDDDNNSATAMVTRRQAYIDLFKGFIDFHTGYFSDNTIQEPGHAPNQEVYQLVGLMTAYRALEAIDPTAVNEVTFAPIIATRLDQAFGFSGSALNGSIWFTDDGLPLECCGLVGGGYSSEYGHGVSGEMFKVLEMAEGLIPTQQLEKLKARTTQTASLWQHFLYPVYNEDGTMDLRLEGAINWRNSKINGLQAIYQDPWFHAALEQNDPAAIRVLQLLAMDDSLAYDAIDGGHYWQQSVWVMEQVARIDQILDELPEDSLRLPHEAGQPDYAWVDPVGGAVSIKLDDRHIFMALNWHHGSSGTTPVANDIARIHEVSPTADFVATVYMENPYGFGELAYLTYDDLLIAANANDALSYQLDIPTGYDSVFDLVSGDYIAVVGGQITLAPLQSVVLNLAELTLIPGDLNGDGFVGLDDLDIILNHWNQTVTEGDLLSGDPTNDGYVGLNDLDIVLNNWNSGTPAGENANIPEPASAALILTAATALLRREH